MRSTTYVTILPARCAIEGYDRDAFLADDRTFYAATRCLEIISEAARRLSPAFKARFPQIPWKEAAGSGNIYRHNYENVQENRVWATIHEALPPLLAVINSVMNKPS